MRRKRTGRPVNWAPDPPTIGEWVVYLNEIWISLAIISLTVT